VLGIIDKANALECLVAEQQLLGIDGKNSHDDAEEETTIGLMGAEQRSTAELDAEVNRVVEEIDTSEEDRGRIGEEARHKQVKTLQGKQKGFAHHLI
jgi:hypothetical protein